MTPALTRTAQALAMTLFYLDGLVAKGLVDGPRMLTPEGKAQAQAINDEGFEFAPGEMEECMHFILSGGVDRAMSESQP